MSDGDLTAETGHKDRWWRIKSDPRQRITRQIQDSSGKHKGESQTAGKRDLDWRQTVETSLYGLWL